LRGALTIGIAAAAGALAASAASAAIIALTITLGTCGSITSRGARRCHRVDRRLHPSAALRVFEHGEFRAATALILATICGAGLGVAVAWLQQGEAVTRRGVRVAAIVVAAALACVAFGQIRASRDVSGGSAQFLRLR